MKCPKCHYLSFEASDRCRNCGYDFSLAVAADADLPLQGGDDEQPLGPMADLALDDLTPALAADTPPALPNDFDLHRIAAPRPGTPLFGASGPPPTPAPRAPLAVRRSSTPDEMRARGDAVGARARPRAAALAAPRLELEPELDADAIAPRPVALGATPAGAARRVIAALVDAAILLSIDLAVLYFTLRLCGLAFGDVLIIPPVPFVGFLLLLNGGYVTAFTAASGQTIGKMASGIKVIGAPGSEAARCDRIGFGFAVLRTAAYLASALPAGLGFLPALVGRDRRALHDRLAETLVIRVSAIG